MVGTVVLLRRVKGFLDGEGIGTAIEYTPIAALIALVLGTLVVAIGKVSETFVIIGNVAGR